MKKTMLLLSATFAMACGSEHEMSEAAGHDNDPAADSQPSRGIDFGQGIPVVDQGAASHSAPPTAPAAAPSMSSPPAAAAAPAAPAQPAQQATPPAAATAQAAGEGPRATVRDYIRKLMDETRIVPDTAAKKGGPRGSPGSFAKLSEAQVDEFVTAIIKGAQLFLPQHLKDEERWALIAAEISIESAFQPGTSGVNPGDSSKVSVGPLQLTLPGMWDDIFRQYANLPGLTHYDGSAWDTKTTDNEALKTSIHDGVIAALWCITETARRGVPDWLGGPDGPCPRTMHTAYLAWVVGGPALKAYQKDPSSPAGDLAGQRDAYLASIRTDLALIGFPADLIEAAF